MKLFRVTHIETGKSCTVNAETKFHAAQLAAVTLNTRPSYKEYEVREVKYN